MDRFEPVLRRAEAALDVPPPARAHILVELAADLESLYDSYRSRGLTDDEAAARAAAALGLSDDTTAELVRLHEAPYQRLVRRLTARGRTRLERTLVTVLVLGVVLGGGAGLARAGLLDDPSPVLWPLLSLGAAGALAAGWLALRLVLARERSGRGPLQLLFAVCLIAPLIALMACVWEAYALASLLSQSGELSLALVVPVVRRTAQSITLALTITLAAALAWFHLRLRLDAFARADAASAAAIRPTGGVQ